MKRTLTIAAILLATFTISSVGVVASPTVAHAGNGSSILAQGQVGAAGVSAAQNATNAQGASPVNGGVVKQGQYSELMTWIMEIFAWLMGVAALLLDASVYWTVVHMGSVLGSSTQLMTTISTVWHTFVDLGDIALIFGFIALGVEVMLGMNFYGGGTKALPMLLLAAVFMNFSLFATEAVVDVGNFLATAVYQQINGGSLPSPSNFASLSSASVNNEPISNAIMAPLGLQTIYTQAFSNSGALNTSIDKSNYVWLIGILGCLLFIIVTFVLLSLAFVLIFRFVVLIFLIIASPLGFAGLIVPQLRGRAKQYWSMLIGEAMSAPILLFLLYVALRVIVNKTFLTGFGITSGGSNAWLGTIGSNNLNGFASILIAFLVAMGLLMVVAIAAKSLSKFGGRAVTLGGAVAFGGAFGGMSIAGRTMLGGTGLMLNTRKMQARAHKSNKNAFSRVSSDLAVQTGKFLSNRTYDPRNASTVKSVAGVVGVPMGHGATLTAQKAKESNWGRKRFQDAAKKNQEEYAKAVRGEAFDNAQNEIKKAKADLDAKRITPAAFDAIFQKQSKVISDTLSKMSNKQIEELGGIKKGVESLVTNLSPQQFEAMLKSDKLSEEEKEKVKKTRFAKLQAAIDNPGDPDKEDAGLKSLKSMGKPELEALPSDMLASGFVLENLSNSQRDTLSGSNARSASERSRVKDLPYRALRAAAASGSVSGVKDELRNMGKTELEQLPQDILAQPIVLQNLNDAQRDTLTGSKDRTAAERKAVKAGGDVAQMEAAYHNPAMGPAFVGSNLNSLTPKQVAKLDKNILKDVAIATQLTPAMLVAIQDEGKLSGSDIQAIATHITRAGSPAAQKHISSGPGQAYWG